MSDPRDAGFNYGRGWGSAPKPPIYLEAMKLSRELNRQRMILSQKAWALDMALWHVRIASLGSEKAAAVRELHKMIADFVKEREEANEPREAELPPPRYLSDG